MNQECVFGGLSVPYSAVPVLPEMAAPGALASDLAVPLVTTSRIIACIASTVAGFNAVPSAAGLAGAGSVSSRGCFHWPRASAAAAPAIAIGDTSVVP